MGELKNPTFLQGLDGSGGGTRTPDLVVNSHSLYQLSYSGSLFLPENSGIINYGLKKLANLG
tara:strand:+ start:56 stop:241 length:186 start_codon:yes stop_codon:yes gene_type:complete